MPICCRPGARVAHVLAGDQKLPDPKPKFFLKAITAEESMTVADKLGEMRSAQWESTREPVEFLCGLLEPYLLGWEHIDGKIHGTDKLQSFLSLAEVKELLQALIGGLAEADKGN